METLLSRCLFRYVKSPNLKPKKWNYIAATYDQKAGLATLWKDGFPVIQKTVGRVRLATNYPAIMGSKPGDRRRFRGRISCLQIYDKALSGPQIKAVKKRCFRVSVKPKPSKPSRPTKGKLQVTLTESREARDILVLAKYRTREE